MQLYLKELNLLEEDTEQLVTSDDIAAYGSPTERYFPVLFFKSTTISIWSFVSSVCCGFVLKNLSQNEKVF